MTEPISEQIGEVYFNRPVDERHATIHAAAGWEGDDPVELTREQARALILLLAEYATSPDPGPGAPYPERRPPTAAEWLADERRHAEFMRDIVHRGAVGLGLALDRQLEQTAPEYGNGSLVPRVTRRTPLTPIEVQVPVLALCPACDGWGADLTTLVRCTVCGGDGFRS